MEVVPRARIPANKVDACAFPKGARPCRSCTGGEAGESSLLMIDLFMKTMVSRVRLAAPSSAAACGLTVAGVFACLGLPGPALSQTTPPARGIQLPETVVTATRNTQLLSAALPHTTVITRDDIARSQATDLVTLLQREAGLQRTQNGGIGTTSSIFIRGAASLDTLILIDGIAQNKQDASGAVSLEHIMLANVDHVEIVRGNVSAIYGSGAIGGVIQIFTKTGSSTPSLSLSADVGPRAFRKLSGALSATAGDTAFTLDVSRVITHGFSAINPAQQSGANPDADAYQNTTANVSVTHRVSQDHRFGATVFHANSGTAYDNAFGAPTDVQVSTTRLSQTSLFTDNTFGNWRSRMSLSEQSDKSRYLDNGSFGSTDSFITRSSVLNWVNTVALTNDWLATAGVEQQRQRVATSTTSAFDTPYERQRNTTAVFAGIEGKAAGGAAQLNVRNDKVGELHQSTGYLGYGYPLSEQLKVTASVSTAFNAPPLGYLYGPGFGNPLLKPELARSKELGLQYAVQQQLLRTTYFDTKTRDQLTYDLTTSAFANINRARNSGVELSYKGQVATQWGVNDLRASLTLQKPIDDTTGQQLSRRARTLASLGVSQPIGALRLGADLQYSGVRPDTYTDVSTFQSVSTTLPSYTLLDMTGAYRLSPGVELRARLDNVTNRAYQTVYGYNQQPRSVYVGITWTAQR